MNLNTLNERSANGGVLWSGDWVLTSSYFTMVVLEQKLATMIASKASLMIFNAYGR